MSIIASISVILLILTWAYVLLTKSFTQVRKITKKDIINQNFTFMKNDEINPKWVTFENKKKSVYSPLKDEAKQMTGRYESYFFKGE